MYTDTITLFNFHAQTGQWYASVFSGVDVGAAKAGRDSAYNTADTSSVRVLLNTGADKAVGGKGYLGPKEYAVCEDPDKHFTLMPQQDFFMVGKYADPGPFPDGSGVTGGFYQAVRDTHDDVYIITSREYFSLIPHFEIGGG